MYYYHVWVRSNRYRGNQALTYSSSQPIETGKLVRVPLQRERVFGVVFGAAKPPRGIKLKSIEQVLDLPALPAQLLTAARWLQAYYRASIGSVTQSLVPAAIPQKLPALEPSHAPISELHLPPLSAEQASALTYFNGPGSYLLHGRTGSGKTRIYQELASRQLAAGKSVLILSPEISLTSQLTASFSVFGSNNVEVLHSAMTGAERFRAWRRIASATGPRIIIGARSALFSPVPSIGLIVVDESHEPAYKQEQEPRYHANRLAAFLAAEHQALLIFGSATPSLVDYYIAEERKRPIVRLTQLAKPSEHQLSTRIIDFKSREHFTRSAYLSNDLVESMTASLANGEQSLLYLNRRGTARISLCQTCGWQAMCPNCDLPLTYHGDEHKLRCHVCNYTAETPISCPKCSNVDIVFRSVGTKAIVSEVERLFPDTRIMRFDSDNAKHDRFENNYADILRGQVDILIGTQTLAKGLDLPLLSTLGILVADASLQMPDYTAGERTYQLLNQVIGRVQRGHRTSRAIIQTYEPDSPLLAAALADDWPTFYRAELAERKLFNYPPFCHLLRITCRRASARSAEQACEKIADTIRTGHPDIEVDGPAPALHEKFKDTYSWQLVLKAKDRSTLLAIIDELPSTATSYDLDPVNLL